MVSGTITKKEQGPALILLRCGERKLVGGQEDQITQIALELAAERG